MSPIDLTVQASFRIPSTGALIRLLPDGGRARSRWEGTVDLGYVCSIARPIKDGQNANVACNRYLRYNDDSRLLAQLGIRSFGYSLSWPRSTTAPIRRFRKGEQIDIGSDLKHPVRSRECILADRGVFRATNQPVISYFFRLQEQGDRNSGWTYAESA